MLDNCFFLLHTRNKLVTIYIDFMAIHRVSVSLSEAEYTQLVQASALLGIKPTTAAHRSIKHGLLILSKEAQALSAQLQSFRFLQQNSSEEPSSNPPKVAKQQPKPQAKTRNSSKISKKRKKRR